MRKYISFISSNIKYYYTIKKNLLRYNKNIHVASTTAITFSLHLARIMWYKIELDQVFQNNAIITMPEKYPFQY